MPRCARPCGAFWSVNAARERAHDDARAATVAVWVARALLAAIYFFPGYWSVRAAEVRGVIGERCASGTACAALERPFNYALIANGNCTRDALNRTAPRRASSRCRSAPCRRRSVL